jgi:(S)-2-hydroxyglutarate dehydrogenase
MPTQLSDPPPAGADIAVVGAGLVGLATARELQRRNPGAELAVLERERRPAAHQSGHSSGVIHAGIYYAPGSLKARLCVEGARRLYELCAERGIAARRDGKLIVAARERELPGLDELERRGRANGVPGLRRLGPEEIGEVEPHARGLAALHSPATGVVDFAEVAAALAAELRAGGARLVGGCAVSTLRERGRGVELRHPGGSLQVGRAVICAGPWADRLAIAAGGSPDPRIVPFRGTYLRLRPGRDRLVRASIYPVPDPALPFLGAHLTRGPTGEVLLGPTALLAGARDAYAPRLLRRRDVFESLAWPGTWRLFRRYWRAGLREVAHAASRRALIAECRRLLPGLRPSDAMPSSHSGVRAQAIARDGTPLDDFLVERTEHTVHVRNAPSPAATASLALAEEIADRLAEAR